MNQHRTIPRQCVGCGRGFLARAVDVAKGLGRTCSRRCGGKMRQAWVRPASHPTQEASHPFKSEEEAL